MDPAGPVALLGSGEFEPWTAELERTLLGHATTGDGTVAIVPTASALEGATFDAWAAKGLEHYASLGIPARVIDLRGRDDAERKGLIDGLAGTSLIFFSGGNPAFLATTLAGSPFWDAVLDRLRAGAAFAGCSAGACVAGAFAPESVTDDVSERGWAPGLELVPDLWVLPHFDALDRHRPGVRGYFLSRFPETEPVLGVDERTAAVRIGNEWRVVGEGGVYLAHGPRARRFGPGERFGLGDALEDGADRDLVLALEPLPLGSGPIALLSSEQFSEETVEVDAALLARCGTRVGVVVDADPSNAAEVGAQAGAHYRSLGAQARVLAPRDDAAEIDLLFLAGGDPKNLVPALQGSPLWSDALHRWREGLGIAGSSAGAMALCERCLFAEPGSDVPTVWGAGLGPLRSSALAVHASSRPDGWLEDVVARAPIDVVSIDDGTSLLLVPGRAPAVIGAGRVGRHEPGGDPATSPPDLPGRPTLRLYHRTPEGDRILRTGFVDSAENGRREGAWEGSWFSDVPLPPEDGPAGDVVLVLDVDRAVAERYEWRDPAKPYRQFVLPREIANRFGPPRALEPDGTILDPEPRRLERGDDVWGS